MTTSSPSIPLNCSASPENAPITRVGKPFKILPTIGKKLPTKNVVVVVARACKEGLMSCPSDNLPNKLVNAAFMEAKEPCNVVDASLAVVPVISNSF